ncbi:MAG: Phenylalanine--tRNA ligase beta subunit [Chloroflexi bacterium]|nr:Phenylalanine--tRNA ligase beta subunit [Chloroflexota bacterium]
MFFVSESWKNAYPKAQIGILTMKGVSNPHSHPKLEERKTALEEELRSHFSHLDREEIRALPTFQAYRTYYKGFKKTYHLLLQLESIVFKGKSLPSGAALVEAMFMAELEDHLLTAGHDLDHVKAPVGVYAAQGDETYTRINGQEQELKAKDMFIADAEGVLSSIIYGPDQRTKIRPETKNVLFTCYAPAGIPTGKIWDHLNHIEEYVKIFSPQATVDDKDVLS